MTDKGKLELQVTVQTNNNDLVSAGSRPPPNTSRSHDPSYKRASVLCVEVDDDRG